MRTTLITALVLATIAMPADAQTMLDKLVAKAMKKKAAPPASATQAEGATASDVASASFSYDVAGVRLGMSPEQVRAALATAGYKMATGNWTVRSPSFAAQVEAKAAWNRTGSYVRPSPADEVVTKLKAYGPNRETIGVSLTAVPAGGSIVTKVDFDVPTEMMGGEAFLRQAVTRYGQPDGGRDLGSTLAWCSPPLRTKAACGSLVPFQRSGSALPNLEASTVFGRNTIRLTDGTDQDRQREQAFKAAVDLAAPKTDKAAF